MTAGDSTFDGGSGGNVQATVAEIRKMVREIQATQKAMRVRSLIATLVILALVFGFATGIYFKLKKNFTEQKMQEAVAAKVQLLLPQLQEPINQTLRDVVPFYVDMGRQRFAAIAPKLEAQVRSQADSLGADLEKKLNVQLDAFFAGLKAHAAAEITKSFPSLATTDGLNRLSEKLSQVMLREDEKLRKEAQQLYAVESKRIEDAFSKFPVPDVRQADIESLNRQLLHNLLVYADYEMVLKDAPELAAPKASR